MSWWRSLLADAKRYVRPTHDHSARRRVRRAPRRTPLATYPDTLGSTACDILDVLSRHPATRLEIAAHIRSTTAGIHLPRLRELDLITVVDGRRPFIYQITEKGRLRLAGRTEFGA